MNFPASDLITPLKKRRLMRESIESLSPHSPDDTDATTSSLTNDMQADTIDQQLISATNEDSVQLSPKKEDEVSSDMVEDSASLEGKEVSKRNLVSPEWFYSSIFDFCITYYDESNS